MYENIPQKIDIHKKTSVHMSMYPEFANEGRKKEKKKSGINNAIKNFEVLSVLSGAFFCAMMVGFSIGF